jgi:hypothetical protein
MFMSIKLTNTQIVMLSAAAKRDDRCLVAPRNLKGGAARKVAAKLIDGGLEKEIKAKPGAPVWRQDEQSGQSFALKLTAAGARAIVIDDSSASDDTTEGGGGRVRVAAPDSEIVQRTIAEVPAAEPPSPSAPPRRHETGAGPRIASARLWRNVSRTDRGDGLASAYHPRRTDRITQARLCGDD